MKITSLSLAMVTAIAVTTASAETYKISIMPRFYNDKLTAMMTPLVEYIKGETGLDLELVLASDNADYEKQLSKGDIAIGFENPVVYVEVAPRHQVIAAAKELGEARFRGIVLVPRDSLIKNLADLRGKRVMMTGKSSAGGFLSQKLSLMHAGIALKELDLETAADNRQENVVIAVSVGDVDAGFVRESSFHVADKYIVPGSVKRVIDTEWMPPWALSVDIKVPQEIKSRLTAAVLKLQPESDVLKALEVDQFISAQDSDYDPVRQALAGER